MWIFLLYVSNDTWNENVSLRTYVTIRDPIKDGLSTCFSRLKGSVLYLGYVFFAKQWKSHMSVIQWQITLIFTKSCVMYLPTEDGYWEYKNVKTYNIPS